MVASRRNEKAWSLRAGESLNKKRNHSATRARRAVISKGQKFQESKGSAATMDRQAGRRSSILAEWAHPSPRGRGGGRLGQLEIPQDRRHGSDQDFQMETMFSLPSRSSQWPNKATVTQREGARKRRMVRTESLASAPGRPFKRAGGGGQAPVTTLDPGSGAAVRPA
jgi:hypothetical protein